MWFWKIQKELGRGNFSRTNHPSVLALALLLSKTFLQSCFPAVLKHTGSTEAASSLAAQSEQLFASGQARSGTLAMAGCATGHCRAACSLQVLAAGVFFSYLLALFALRHQNSVLVSRSVLKSCNSHLMQFGHVVSPLQSLSCLVLCHPDFGSC